VDERTDQIEDHIRSTQRELGSNLEELESRVRNAVDWRVQFERHPAAFLGVAFAGGLLLSAGFGGRRTRGANDMGSWTPGAWAPGANFSAPSSSAAGARKSAVSDTWNGIKGALIAAAGTQVRSVLSELVPGFRDHDGVASRPFAPAASAGSANGGREQVHASNNPLA
jgi:hypothetical protein